MAWQAFVLYATNLVAIILTASSVLLFSGFMPDRKNIALYVRVIAGMIAAVLIVVLVAIPLTTRTLNDFRDAHDRRIAISVVREWIGKNSAEIVDVEIEDNLLQVFLRINLPMESLYKREHLATNANLGEEMTLESLKQSLTAVIVKEVNVTLKGSFAFWESTCPVPEDCYY